MRRAVWLLAAAVVGLQIAYPLVHGGPRDTLTVATVVVFATFSVTHAAQSRGLRTALALLSVFGAGGFAAEVLGVHTGVPFGDYRYTGGLGPQVAGVPVVVALAWVMMAEPSLCVAARLASGRAARAAVATVALAGWDVFLDPQMVQAHHWRWLDVHAHLPGVADVPLSNLGGWLLVALVLTTTMQLVGPVEADPPVDRPAVTLWLWTWSSSALANVAFFDRPAVAAWGTAAMGLVGVPLLRRLQVPRRVAC